VTALRPVVCIVTTHWGASDRESTDVVRLLAGAVASAARVEVIFLDEAAIEPATALDSVFTVHHLPLAGTRPLAGSLLQASLRAAGASATPPSMIEAARELGGSVHGISDLLQKIAPDVLVVAGLPLPLGAEEIVTATRARTVVWPLLADPVALGDPVVAALLESADAIGSLHPGEQAALSDALHEKEARVRPLDIALTLNRSATEQGLFGVTWFGKYVLLLRRFPASGARFDRAITRELLRAILGDIAIAEVDGAKWRVTDFVNTATLPVNPTRVNLWRLMAHAEFTVDLRPPGPFGREALESMLFSSPPIVPEGSAAHAHVAAANGGLWYRTPGEALDLASTLIDDDGLLSTLRSDGLAYSVTHHEQMAAFVERTIALVLG
jgi:hypothetical protein